MLEELQASSDREGGGGLLREEGVFEDAHRVACKLGGGGGTEVGNVRVTVRSVSRDSIGT